MLKFYPIWIIGFMILSFQNFIPNAYGQFQQLPTPQKVKPTTPSNRVQSDPLSLPFFDDFSSGRIDTLKWISEGVTYSNSIANSPPSKGVAVLDGVNQRGQPYSTILVAQGPTDQLTSAAINLVGLTPAESSSVYLSFFWQPGGKGEMPDVNDQIRLQFLGADDLWVTVWNQFGELPAEQLFFTQEIVQVDPEFHHPNFRFRFQIEGRSSGPFDTWLLDYIYLNSNRNPTRQAYPDRTLTQPNSRPFEKYSAIPLSDLQRSPEGTWGSIQNEFNNLENRFRAMEYSIELRDISNGELVKNINSNTPFNPVPLALERRTFGSNPFGNVPVPSEETAYEIITYISSGDRFMYELVNGDTLFFPQIDLRQNDTVRTEIPIRDFYAYDDGSADYSAGVNQRDGMLANRFEVRSPSYVKGISINFTNFTQVDNVLDLKVWSSLDNNPIFVQEVFIPDSPSLNSFAYFEIEENIRVEGRFFVGFTQFTNDFIYVGLDKTFDTGSEIFYNVSGVWQQNEQVEGSLMIRVHLSDTPPVTTEAESSLSLRVYPNPVTDYLTIEGDSDLLEFYDPYGRQLDLQIEEYLDNKQKRVYFRGLNKGIYVVKITQGTSQKSFRILVR